MLQEDRLQTIESNILEIKEMLRSLINKQDRDRAEVDVAYLSVKEAAKLLNVQPSLIYSKCNNGNLPHVKVGKYYKFKNDELLQWMNQPKLKQVNVEEYVHSYLQKNVLKG